MMQKTNMRSMRKPWTIFTYRIFGDLLPFIGYETVEADIHDLHSNEYEIDTTKNQKVYGDFFSFEWLGYGISFGGFRVPVKR